MVNDVAFSSAVSSDVTQEPGDVGRSRRRE